MVAVVQLERRVAGACILGVVISKLSYWQEPCPIILLKIDKDSKISFHCAVLPLRLAVCLRVKGNGEPPLDAKKVAER